MPEKLYLTGYKLDRWAATIKAVRDVRGLLYDQDTPSITEAHDIVEAFRKTREPQLVAENDDVDALEQAAALLDEVDALFEINPILETEENVVPEGNDADVVVPFTPGERPPLVISEEGIRATLVTLAFAQGSPQAALVMANTYLTATEEPTWEEVRDMLISTFPGGDAK